MKSSLNRNLLIGFSISLLILILSSAASFISIRSLLRSSAEVAHTNEVVQHLDQTISDMKDAETGQRGYLLTGKEIFLDPYNGALDKVKAHISALKELTIDNNMQQVRLGELSELVTRRFSSLQNLIDLRKSNLPIELNELYRGKSFMDSVRAIVKNMTDRERTLLDTRTATMNRFSAFTPVLIIIAAFFALLITIVFYLKVKKDIADKAKLQEELVQKDISISNRIETINHIARQISSGDYSVRVEDTDNDNLGSISGALNKMAHSLEVAFTELADREWLKSGIAGLNDTVIGDNDLNSLTQKLMSFISSYTDSLVGAFYIAESDEKFALQNGFALAENPSMKTFRIGEGLPGECARTHKMIVVKDIPKNDISISFAAASVQPTNIALVPVLYQGNIKAVIELGSINNYTERDKAFLGSIGENIGIAINTVQTRQKVQELLEETQAQAEELMSQQSELEQINVELETQAQQLQTSEEELKVQSEELIETNTLLEERAGMLAQQNELIIEKNNEIQKRSEELALSTKYKSEFLANMSHELRTPLNSILLLSRLMSENNEQNLSPDQVQYAQVIQSSGNGLLQLIDEILDLSKIEAGKMTIEYLPVQVSEMIHDVNVLFEPMAKMNNVEWKIDVHTNVPAVIETDKMRLEQVLKNLLSNAFKFTQKGFVQLTLNCPENRPGFICFIVKDSGIGISADKLDLIFEAFQQEDGSTRRKFGGTGLGLSISRELGKLLGGEITVSSTPGEGSEFVLCIPVHHVQFPVAGKEPEAMIQKPVKRAAVSGVEIKAEDKKYHTDIIPEDIEDDRADITEGDKILLIVEDDTAFAKALVDYARQKGYKAVATVRGDVGIELARQYRPAGILLDIQLPVKNGWEVLEALKSDVLTRHIPVHIMSSFEVKKESLLKGAIDFINKPVAFEQLNTIFDKIEFVLSKKEKKVLIIEENYKHAKALAYYLGTYNVHTEINQSLEDSITSLHKSEVDCVILDMGVTEQGYEELLEQVKQSEGLEHMPVILFTGKQLTQPEEFKLKKYADAIVLKTANSYQRILDEVTLFLHMVQEQNKKEAQSFEHSVMQESVLKGKTVLLADDDVRNIFSMTKAMEKYGLRIIPAMDGKEAIDLLTANPAIDIVLMDIMMPEMDGYESIRNIRKQKRYKDLPIIAVTAKAMSGDREKCIAAGASDYISKPVDMDQLVSLLRIWLYE